MGFRFGGYGVGKGFGDYGEVLQGVRAWVWGLLAAA